MDRSVSGAQPGSPAERERLARIMDEQANDAEGTARLCRRIGTTEIAATHDRDATDLRAIAALLRGETRHDAAQEERWALDAQRLDWLERVREPLAPFLDRGFPVWRVADYEQDVTLRGAIDRARKELSGQPSLPAPSLRALPQQEQQARASLDRQLDYEADFEDYQRDGMTDPGDPPPTSPQEQKALPKECLMFTEDDGETICAMVNVGRTGEQVATWLNQRVLFRSPLSSPSAGRKEVLASGRAAEASVVQGTEQQPESPPTTSHDPFFKYRDPFNPGWVEFCGDCGAPCVVVRPGKTQCESCDWWRFGNSESERNARIVAALRAKLVEHIARTTLATACCCAVCTVLDRILSAGEPAPSEEQRLPKGACPKCGGLAACWCGMPNAESPPAQSKTLPEDERELIRGALLVAADAYIERVPPEEIGGIAGHWRCTECDAISKRGDEHCSDCPVKSKWDALAAFDRLSSANVVPQSGVEPESVTVFTPDSARDFFRWHNGQPLGDDFAQRTADELNRRIRSALSLTPRDQA